VQVYGSARDRQGKIDWLERQDCRECQRSVVLAAANQAAEEHGLPPLRGTEKQAAWATCIRAEVWRQVHSLPADVRPKLVEFEAWLWPHEEAKWWINTRLVSPSGSLFSAVFGHQDVDFRSFVAAWGRQIKEEAEEELRRERRREELDVLDRLQAGLGRTVNRVKVWSSETHPEDRRVYVDDGVSRSSEPVYTAKDDKAATDDPDVLAVCRRLCKRWKKWSTKR